jgi:hypothetical protein
MPTFCRHNRFVERCPICSKSLPGNEAGDSPRRATRSTGAARVASPRPRKDGLRVRHEGRATEDGYRNELVPGLRASADAERLARELDFSSARLAALAIAPPGPYGHACAEASTDLERATWTCFLLAYISPSEDAEPFAGIARVLDAAPGPERLSPELGALLDSIPLGPRTSHQPGRGTQTLHAYGQWLARMGGAGREQAVAFGGDPGWTAERRFGRLFERLTLPGLSRAARYELLLVLGRLGLYELEADALHLSGPGSAAEEDATTLAAKRVFGIADPLLLDRRAAALAAAAAVPLAALDLALANWGAEQRAIAGFDGIDLAGLSGAAARALGV